MHGILVGEVVLAVASIVAGGLGTLILRLRSKAFDRRYHVNGE